jgi:aspartate dehydrogenase
MTNIGLLGCGAIGTEIATAVCAGKVGDAHLAAVFDQDQEMASSLAEQLPESVPHFTDFSQFLDTPGLEMVVECAAPAAVRAHAEGILTQGKDLLMISSGALTDTALFQRLADLARDQGLRLMVPSGALGGIDAIRAVRHLLDEVTLTTTKPPRGLQGAPGFKEWESREITSAQVVFEGNALEAIKLFPANVNVGATLGLAGLGPEKTLVKVVADPDSSGNVHEIYARGTFGVMRFRLENVPHERNPRTSFLAVLSVLETLRAACTPGPRIGT